MEDEKNVDAFLERYPGNEFVHLVGVDIYEFDNNDANYQKNLTETLDVMMLAAKKINKIPALSEQDAEVFRRSRTGSLRLFGLC